MFNITTLSDEEYAIWETASAMARTARIHRDAGSHHQAAKYFRLASDLYASVGDATLAAADSTNAAHEAQRWAQIVRMYN